MDSDMLQVGDDVLVLQQREYPPKQLIGTLEAVTPGAVGVRFETAADWMSGEGVILVLHKREPRLVCAATYAGIVGGRPLFSLLSDWRTQNRREHKRFAVHLPIAVRETEVSRPMAAVVMDVSFGGLRLRAKRTLKGSIELLLPMPGGDMVFPAEVVSCEQRDGAIETRVRFGTLTAAQLKGLTRLLQLMDTMETMARSA